MHPLAIRQVRRTEEEGLFNGLIERPWPPGRRIQQMQEDAGVPLPAGAQYGLVETLAQELEPIHDESIKQAADGHLFFNDDTTARILSHGRRNFVEVADDFPQECAYVLETIRYLATLRRYIRHVREGPSAWMPWNYQAAVAAPAGA